MRQNKWKHLCWVYHSYIEIFKRDMLHKCNVIIWGWSGHQWCHWNDERSPLACPDETLLNLSDMSWTIEGPVTWFWISEGLQAQFFYFRNLMTMWYFCSIAATVTNSIQCTSIVSIHVHLEPWRIFSLYVCFFISKQSPDQLKVDKSCLHQCEW